jgi:hypothetical protein
MSNVIPLPVPPSADAAWARYQALASRMIDDPRLALNRGFMEQMATAEQTWKVAFLAYGRTLEQKGPRS